MCVDVHIHARIGVHVTTVCVSVGDVERGRFGSLLFATSRIPPVGSRRVAV